MIAFFKLIRWPNLLMIAFTQILLQYLVISHVFQLIQMESPLNHLQFVVLLLSTVFMAAFGYVYNDIQDVEIDAINKKSKQIVETQISKKWARRLAYLFLILALILALYLALNIAMWQLFLIHISIALGLWYYSKEWKKRAIIGNLLISIFTALSIYIVWIYHLAVLRTHPVLMVDSRKVLDFIHILVLSLSVFAFLISLIRELIKDVEDKRGDSQNGLRTFAVLYGAQKTKVIVCVLSLVMMFFIGVAAYYSYQFSWTKLSIYFIVAVGIPMLYFIVNLNKSKQKEDFENLSTLAKIIMLAGILSMQVFYISYI